MIKVQLYNQDGQAGGNVEVDETVLGEKVNLPVLRQVVRMYEANRRVGTRHVKTRAEVAATTKKLYRQKHTGNARAGSRVAGHRRGGGKAHGPQAQDWSQSVPKKVRRLAIRSALLARLQDSEVSLLDSLALDVPSTRTVVNLLASLGIRGSCLIVADGEPEALRTLWKSARNIPGVEVRSAADANAYDLLRPKRVLFTRSAFEAFMEARTS